jgi:hypothetical protein
LPQLQPEPEPAEQTSPRVHLLSVARLSRMLLHWVLSMALMQTSYFSPLIFPSQAEVGQASCQLARCLIKHSSKLA